MEKEYDIRKDEEQEKKSQEVLELLVTAGYFRARIKVNRYFVPNLRFDKIFKPHSTTYISI